jgi:hypothetical protein
MHARGEGAVLRERLQEYIGGVKLGLGEFSMNLGKRVVTDFW